MRNRCWHSLFILCIALLCSGTLSARELERRTGWPQETSDLKPDPGAVFGRLDNGMGYVLLPNDTPKDRVSLRLLVDAGSLMEREDERGLAHVLEHMAFKGSQNMPAGDLVQYLQRLGMAFGADTNARTSYESTVYQLELPNNTPQLLDRSLFVLREKADHLLIPAAELDRERGVVLSEKRMRDTAQFRSTDANLHFLLPGTVLAERMPIGVEEVVGHAPRERLEAFYRTWYTPSRMTLVAVGAIDAPKFAELLHKHFDSFKGSGQEARNPDLGELKPRGLEARLHYEADGRTNVALQTVQAIAPHPDTHEYRVKEMNLYLANAVISRRLATLALQTDAPFLGGNAHSTDFLDFARIGAVVVNTQQDKWQRGLASAEQELRRALTYGFTDAELDEQRKTLLSDFQEKTRAAGTRESRELAEEVVDTLSDDRVFTHPLQDLEEMGKILAGVTPQSALAALRELWNGGGGPLVFVSGPIQLDNAAAAITDAYRASQKIAVAPPAQNTVHEFAYNAFGTTTDVVDRHVTDVLQITQLRFANSVRVNLKPTKFEANSVLVSVRFGGGRLELPLDKPGLEQLAESAFIAGGLEKHSIDELNRIIAGRSVGLGFDVDDDAFVLAGRTTPSDLKLQLQLLAAYMIAPGYRAEALTRFRHGLPQLYQGLDRTASGVMQKEVVRFLRNGDPRFGYPEQATLASRTLTELREAMKAALDKGYVEVSIVGDFDLDKATEAVAATFGSLAMREPSKPSYADQRSVRFPDSRALTSFPYDTSDPKALAVVYWPTTDFSNVHDVRRLYVLAKVLGNRVLERARNVEGLTYTAQGDHAASQVFPGYGFMYAVVDAPPEKARMLAEEIAAIGSELQRDGVTQDELERARNPVVNELKRLLSTNSYLMSAIITGSQEKPEKLARSTTSVKELSALTVDDLNAVARKYLKPGAALPVVVLPRSSVKTTLGPAEPAPSVQQPSVPPLSATPAAAPARPPAPR